MARDPRVDIQKTIDEASQRMSISNLQNMGVRNVKVLDERTILELIRNAVDQVISSATEEERARLVAQSRKELENLLKERNEFMTRSNMLESGKNDLMSQIEKLQSELKLRRQVTDKGEDELNDLRSKNQELLKENAFVRGEHDNMVELVDQLQTENAELKKEIARLKVQIAQLQEELDQLRAGAQQSEADAGELEAARAEIATLKDTMADQQRRSDEEISQLTARLDEQALESEKVEESLKEQQAELEARLREAAEEAERLKEPPPEPIVVLPAEPLPPPKPKKASNLLEASAALARGETTLGKGLDIGTVNLVAAEQNEQGEVALRLKRNAFIDVEVTPYTKSMMTRLKVPYVVQNSRMFVLGDDAFELANVLNKNTRRPMADGLISPKEQDALPVMKLLISSILGEPRQEGEVCFYSVPGDPLDSELSVAYHRDLFDAVLKSLGYKPSHIIEGHAVTFAELADEDFTGIGVSCGGGMFNVCVAYKSMPALTFSSARSGDWIDQNVAQALALKPAKASLIKEKGVDLMNPKTREEDAISIYYQNLIKYNLTNIADRFRSTDNMPSFPDPITMVFSGGTALAGNFIELVRKCITELDFPIPIKEVRLAKDPLNATAKGALVAAVLEMAQQTE